MDLVRARSIKVPGGPSKPERCRLGGRRAARGADPGGPQAQPKGERGGLPEGAPKAVQGGVSEGDRGAAHEADPERVPKAVPGGVTEGGRSATRGAVPEGSRTASRPGSR